MCETSSTDQVDTYIKGFTSNKTDAKSQEIAIFLRIAKLKKNIKNGNHMLKEYNIETKIKLQDLRRYQNIGSMHYDMNKMTEVTGNCKVTSNEVKQTLKNFTTDMDYLFSMQENAGIKVYFKLDILCNIMSMDFWVDNIMNNIDNIDKEIDESLEKFLK